MKNLMKEALEKVSKEDKEKELNQIAREVIPIIDSMKNDKSKIGVLTGKGFTEVDEYGTKVLCITGGLNGCGEWKNYFIDLAKVFARLEDEGYHVWTIKLENDCLDDVFTLKTGIRRKKDDE